MATETPHQVRVALKPAARSQAPKRYQTSAGSSRPRSGVKMRAMPAKSMAQKAMARTIDQRRPMKARSPRTSRRANPVVLKLKISKAARAPNILTPQAAPWPRPPPCARSLPWHRPFQSHP